MVGGRVLNRLEIRNGTIVCGGSLRIGSMGFTPNEPTVSLWKDCKNEQDLSELGTNVCNNFEFHNMHKSTIMPSEY